MKHPLAFSLFAVASTCLFSGASSTSIRRAIEAAVHHESRLAEDRERDPDRKPVEVLTFAGIRPGMTVADLMAGDGWYTELLARVVGPSGTVYTQNNSISGSRYGERLQQRLVDKRLPGVIALEQELHELSIPQPLDAALMVQFYHDTVWMQVDRSAMNKRILESLKPGGVLLIIDHAALDPRGDDQTKQLHRIGEELVIEELQKAGFALEARSDLLRNDQDARTMSVFAPAIRGKTDRFVLRLRKPSSTPASEAR